MHTKVPAHCSADVCVWRRERKGLLRQCFLTRAGVSHVFTHSDHIKTRPQIHEHVSPVFHTIKDKNEGKKIEREQRQEELKLDKEIWIHISPPIHAAKQSQSWKESKRISTKEPGKGSYRMENPAGRPGVSLRGFQHS